MTAVRVPLGWLDAAVVAGSVVTAGAVGLAGPGALPVVAAVIAVVLVAWFAGARRLPEGSPWRWAFLALLIAACSIGASASPAFATFQVLALPLAWLLTPGFRSALVVNAAVATAVAVGYSRTTGPFEAMAVQGLSFGFSVVMGAWITRIEHRSAERQAVVERLTAAQAQIAALNREAGVVAERERLARDLHDTLAQSLAGIVLLAGRARSAHPDDTGLEVLEEAARQAMTEARALVTAAAGVPMEGGLAAALAVLAERFERETGLGVAVQVRAEVPRGLEVVLLRCAQEGLANVRKHAAAGAVAVIVERDGGGAVMTITDDGAGPGDGRGFGIAGMRDRLALVGGSLDLGAAAHGGTVLAVRVPGAEVVR